MRRTRGVGRLRAAAGALALALGAFTALAGCGDGGSGGGAGADGAGGQVSTARLTVAPGDEAAQVPTTGAVRVSVAGGKLTEVKLVDDSDSTASAPVTVPGTLTDGGTLWRPAGRLRASTRYSLDAVAVDPDGRQAAKHADFTTVVPTDTFIGFYTPDAGTTVGVGMEVSLRFSREIADRAAVQQGVRVTASPPVPVVGHWFGDQRLDFRPRQFWKPGTKVTLHLDLRGVEGAPGVYGTQHKDVTFTVGRRQVSTVSTVTDTMTVYRDGTVLRTLPISAGQPGHSTYDGIMVVTDMFPVTRMNSATVGLGSEYDIPDVPHAMRLTDSGTFVHGNWWRPVSTFGAYNTSHGCIGLHDVRGGSSDTPAGWLYDHTLPGDVFEVSGSPGGTVAPDNGLNGWNMSWAQWIAGSAVPVPAGA